MDPVGGGEGRAGGAPWIRQCNAKQELEEKIAQLKSIQASLAEEEIVAQKLKRLQKPRQHSGNRKLGLWKHEDTEEKLTPVELLALHNEEDDESLCSFSTHGHCKHKKKIKSGMDKATANVSHEEICPQKSLLEDLADADLEFQQLQFDHLVAGEIWTIKTCTNPSEIIGRLQSIRRVAYLTRKP